MEQLWWDASVWLALALASNLISLRIGISVALVELIVGIIAGNIFHPQITEWINFLGIITKEQYSILVVVVILTAIIPTLIAQAFFEPKGKERNLFTGKGGKENV